MSTGVNFFWLLHPKENSMPLISLTLILFLVIDPLGNINNYLHFVREIPIKRQRWIILREMLIALGVMLLFDLIGDFLLHLLGISNIAVHLTVGILLFLSAVGIIFPNIRGVRMTLSTGKEPFITPLAIPIIAGPSLLGMIMLFSHLDPTHHTVPLAIIIAWLLSTLVLLFSSTIERFLGNNGLMAFERLIGMVLVMIAIQRFLEGISLFMKA